MARKSTKAIIAVLKKAGVNVEDQDKVEGLLDDIEFDPSEFAGDEHVVLDKADYRQLKDDLTALRQRAKAAESERDQLKQANEAGDSVNKTRADRLQTRVDQLEPLVKDFMSAQTEAWKAAAGNIPDNLKARFHFPEEGKELTPEQLLANMRKLNEYQDLGVIKPKAASQDDGNPPAETPPNGAPRVPAKQTPAKLTPEQLADMPASSKMQAGYKSATGS